ncbi:MAG: Fis family transcriptional regulator [Campylobacteraceae bacterium]|nr:Fis family transcriptional regulator [Campylobacteraceae bacterium]
MINSNFIANSHSSKEAGRLANLLKNLNLSALIIGEKGVGKITLAQNIVDANIVDGEDFPTLIRALSSNSILIVKNFDKVSNFILLKDSLKTNPTRIIATSTKKLDEKITDIFFGLKIVIPPLSERPEDIEALAQKFYEEAINIFTGSNDKKLIDMREIDLDLSSNAYSLRRSVYNAFLVEQFKENDLLNLLEKFLMQRLGSGDDYRKLLYLFDVPLLKAGFKKFHSQLAMSKNFGLNRNTLRKKVTELRHFFENDEYKS